MSTCGATSRRKRGRRSFMSASSTSVGIPARRRVAVSHDPRNYPHARICGCPGEHGQTAFQYGRIAPTPQLVDQYFNDSTGEGDHGEVDARGPWNEGEPWSSRVSRITADHAK